MAENANEENEPTRQNRRNMLKEYYGTSEDIKPQNIYDINEAYFQHEKYLDKLFKEKSLHELMDKESEIIKRKIYFSSKKKMSLIYIHTLHER